MMSEVREHQLENEIIRLRSRLKTLELILCILCGPENARRMLDNAESFRQEEEQRIAEQPLL